MQPQFLNRSNTSNSDPTQLKKYTSIRKNGSIYTPNTNDSNNNNVSLYTRPNIEDSPVDSKFKQISYKDRLVRENYTIKQQYPQYQEKYTRLGRHPIRDNPSFQVLDHNPKNGLYSQMVQSQKVLRLRPLINISGKKFTQQTKIKQKTKTKKSSVRPCGSPNCKICNKNKSNLTRSKEHLAYLARKKTKPPIPYFPIINKGKNVDVSPKQKVKVINTQEQLQLLFDETPKSRLIRKNFPSNYQTNQRRVKSVMDAQKYSNYNSVNNNISNNNIKFEPIQVIPEQNFYNKQFRTHKINKYYTQNQYQPVNQVKILTKSRSQSPSSSPVYYPQSYWNVSTTKREKQKQAEKKIIKLYNKFYEVLQDDVEKKHYSAKNKYENQDSQILYLKFTPGSKSKANLRNRDKSKSVQRERLISLQQLGSRNNTIQIQNWDKNNQQQKKQRQMLNKQAEKYFKYNTVYFQTIQENSKAKLIELQNANQSQQNSSVLLNDERGGLGLSRITVPQKIMLYKFKDYSQSKNIKQSNLSQLQNDERKFYSAKKQYVHDQQMLRNKLMQRDKDQEENIQVYNIHFPHMSEIQESIKNYVPLTGQVSMQTLRKSKDFIKEYSNQQGRQFLYFGGFDHSNKHRKGFGVLVTKKLILQGVWMKGNIIRGAQLRANSLYKGQFKSNKKSGEGICKWLNGQQYMGEWEGGLRNGQGFWTNKGSTQTYSGQWKNGKVNGYGQYTKKNYSVFKGKFINFVKNGQGIQQFYNGDKFQGQFQNGLPNGMGIYIWQCGLVFEGIFKKGLRQGKGRLRKQGLFNIEGNFQNEKPHGICQLKLSNNDLFNGKYIYGQKYGYGKLQLNGSNFIEQGFWNNGLLQQKLNDIS